MRLEQLEGLSNIIRIRISALAAGATLRGIYRDDLYVSSASDHAGYSEAYEC